MAAALSKLALQKLRLIKSASVSPKGFKCAMVYSISFTKWVYDTLSTVVTVVDIPLTHISTLLSSSRPHDNV